MNGIDAYAESVVSGHIPAGKYHRLACARHLKDLKRQGSSDFPYRFEITHAERFFRFAEQLRHYKGEWAGQPIRLTDFQKFRLGNVFGWRQIGSGLRRFTTAYNEMPRKQGKALALDTPVPTPFGWKNHGDLKVGDLVFGPDGRPKRVEWVGPEESGPCFRLTVSTGDSIVAHAAHEWVTKRTWYTGRPNGSMRPMPPVETQRIAETLRCGSRGDFVHRITVAGALELPDADLPIPPYVLGAWLGDGTTDNGSITFADEEIAERIRADGIECRAVSARGEATLYRLDGRQGSQDSFTSRLRRAGVLGKKRIPPRYLRASYAQRLELLRGIVDTDGYLGPKGIYEIVSVNQCLAGDILELIHTLGLTARLRVDRAQLNGQDIGPRYRIGFSAHIDQVATLKRKQSQWKSSKARRSRARTVVACQPCDPVPVNCIQVDGGVYLAGRHFVQTHNSLEAAVVGIYVTFYEGEPGAEGYCLATKEKQATDVVFRDIKQLIVSSGLKNRLRVQVKNVHNDATMSKLEPLGSDSETLDGLNPHLIITDELHAFKVRSLLDVMETATGARRNPLHYQITTAGDDLVSVCGDQHIYATKILEGLFEDAATDTFFACIAHADETDDWLAESTWRKANPHYGISVKPDDLMKLALKAKNMPSAVAEFKQKRLGLWVNTDAPCLSMDGWHKGQSHVEREAFMASLEHESCYVGIDLGSKIDLCSMSLVFPPSPGRPKFSLIQYIWTPEDTLIERALRDRAPYDVWIDQGWLIAAPGTAVDYQVIRKALNDVRRRYDIEIIGFDKWHADQISNDLKSQDGFHNEQIVEIPQNFQGLTASEGRFKEEVLAGNVDANGCPVTAWAASNVVEQTDGPNNILFVKKKSRGRIDPIKSATIALACWMKQPPAPKYEVYIIGGRPS